MRKVFLCFLILLLSFSVFADTYTVSDLLSLMEENCAEVRKAREEVNKASLDISDARGGYYPSVDLTLSGSYIANPIEAIRINPSDYITVPGVSTSDYVTLYKGQESTYYQFKVELIQPIYTSGKLSSAVKLAKEAYEVRLLALDKAIEDNEVKLRAECAALYYLQDLLSVVTETSSLSRRLVELSQIAYENGMMIESDYKNVVAKARATDAARDKVLSQIMSLEADVVSLSGVRDFTVSSLVFDEKEALCLFDKISSYPYEELKEKALSEERTVFTLLNRMESLSVAAKKFASAKVSWKPDVALVVDFDYSGSRFPLVETDWYRQDDWSGTVTVAIKTTLFDGGSSSREVSRAVSDITEAEIDSSQAQVQVLSTLAENYGTFISSASEIDYQSALRQALESTAETKKTLMDTGYGSESDYVQALIEVSSCRSDIIRAQMDRAVSAYTVAYLCGF